MSSSVHNLLVIVDLVLQLEVLLLLLPVAEGADHRTEEETSVDGERLDVSSVTFAKDTEAEVDGRSPDQDYHILILEVSTQEVEVGLNLGQSDLVLSEDSLSPSDVLVVTHDTCVHVRVKKVTEPLVVPTILKNVERCP